MPEHIGRPWNNQTLIILPYWADRCQSCQGVVRALSGHCQGTIIPCHSTSFHTIPHCSGMGSTVFHLSRALWNTSQFYRCTYDHKYPWTAVDHVNHAQDLGASNWKC